MGCFSSGCLSTCVRNIWEAVQNCSQFLGCFGSGGDCQILCVINNIINGGETPPVPPQDETDKQEATDKGKDKKPTRDPGGSTSQSPEATDKGKDKKPTRDPGGSTSQSPPHSDGASGSGTTTKSSSKNAMETVKVGLWGNITDGDPFEHTGFDGIQSIYIYCSVSGIHSIKVQYTKQGQLPPITRREGDKIFSRKPNEIKLEGGDFIKKVSGYYRPYGGEKNIRALTFTTNRSDEPEGPYGANHEDTDVEQFSVGGGKIVGFYGNADKNYVYAIGFYVLPLNADDFITVGPWGKTTPEGPKQNHFPALHNKAGIETLKISHSAVIDSIRVKYRNKDEPDTIGGVGGTPDKEIRFKDGEFINKVIGYYGRFKEDEKSPNLETINKLIFTTNRQERPFIYGNEVETWDGKTKATEFCVEGGRIVGFQGTGGTYVSSIGFYILPKDPIN